MTAQSMSDTQKSGRSCAAGAFERKALQHHEFGLCVLLPKPQWSQLPAAGPARVEINGALRRVTVRVERCNCRGEGWHEHRFLALPRAAGVTPGERVVIGIAATRAE